MELSFWALLYVAWHILGFHGYERKQSPYNLCGPCTVKINRSVVRMRPNTHKDRSHFHFNPELLLALWYFGDASLNLEDKIAQRKTENFKCNLKLLRIPRASTFKSL